jgi:hypothetical protein
LNSLFVVLFAESHALYSQQKHDNKNKTNANKINHNLETDKKKKKKTLIALIEEHNTASVEEHNTRVEKVNYTTLTFHKINDNK